MSEPFDPYYIWLGIPPEDQPPNHYRLLGVTLFEANREVIEAAANRQMNYLQELASGPDVAEAQKLLAEISKARVCLLKAKNKAAYDEQLRSTLPVLESGEAQAEEEGEEEEVEVEQPAAVQRPDVIRSARPARAASSRSGTARRPVPRAGGKRKKNQTLPLLMMVAGGTAVAVAVLIVVLMGGSGKSGGKKTSKKPTVSKKSPEGNGIPLPGGGKPKQKPKSKSQPKPAPLKPKPKPTPPGPAKSKPESQQKPALKKPKPVLTPPPTPAGDGDSEAAAAALLENKGLEKGFSGTWQLVNEQTRKLEALETSGSSGPAGGAAFEAELKRRVDAKKKAILDRWMWVSQQPSGNPAIDEEYNRFLTIVRFPHNRDARYVRDEVSEITSIRAEVEQEFASRGPATVDPAMAGLIEDIRNRYATLAANPKVQAALKTVDGTLAGPPNDVTGENPPAEGDPNAQVAGNEGAGKDPNAQPPSETNSEGKNEPGKEDPSTQKPPAEGKAPSQPDATFDELKEQLTAAEKQTKIDYVKFNKEVKEYIKKRKELVNAIGPLQRLVKQLQQKLDATPEGERKVAIGQQIEAGPMKKLKELQQKLSGLPKPNPAQLEAGLATAGKLIEKIRGTPEYQEKSSSINSLESKIAKYRKGFEVQQGKMAK